MLTIYILVAMTLHKPPQVISMYGTQKACEISAKRRYKLDPKRKFKCNKHVLRGIGNE
jgi:hypothetical protein